MLIFREGGEGMNTIFSYGTFRSPYVQERLFGHRIAATPAVLADHAVCAGGDGYHGLLPREGARVSGELLALTDREFEIADGWEIYPTLYDRRELELQTEDGPTLAWVYFRADPKMLGNQLEDGSLLCTLSQDQLDRELDEYTEELSAKGLLIENPLI
jgi:gamma-glutamylcyclotransferase (GGCT)/AIG2-like uncharacterized protein YtfP